MKKVLVVGSGAREHALTWKLAQSSQVGEMIRCSGKEEFEDLAKEAKAAGVDLAVIGPDGLLAEGIVDVLQEAGIPCFGPTAEAAQIEASKSFAKEVMEAAGVPTAQFLVVNSLNELKEKLKTLEWKEHGWVIKVDGLALGKGVRVCDTLPEALKAAEELSQFGDFQRFVVEEKLIGEEISWMAFCDGEECALLDPARDYKRLLDNDRGPNTGGMGAFSPIPDLPKNLADRVREQVFRPTLKELKRRGILYRGLLYAGLMWNNASDQLWVLEFNARFGDPEAQVLLPRMEGDFYEWCEAVAHGRLNQMPRHVPFSKDFAVYVVAASKGYPELPIIGQKITFTEQANAPLECTEEIFFGGVSSEPREKKFHKIEVPRKGPGWPFRGRGRAMDGPFNFGEAFFPEVRRYRKAGAGLITNGGRVLGALGKGRTLPEARERAYLKLKTVSFEGMQFRRDIGANRE